MSGIIHANRQSRSPQCRFENNADHLRRGSLLALDQRGASSQHQQGPSPSLDQSLSRSRRELRLRDFRTVDASRMLRAIAKEKDLTRTTLQHIKSVLSTIFTYAKNEGAFDGANPVDGVLIPWNAREPGETHAYDLGQVLQILDLLPLLAKTLVVTAAFTRLRQGELARTRMDRLHGYRIDDQSFDLDVGGQPSEDARQPRFRAGNSCLGGNLGRIPQVHG